MLKLKFKAINTIINYINENNNYDSCIVGNNYKYYDIRKFDKNYCIEIYNNNEFVKSKWITDFNELINNIINFVFEEGDYINIYQYENTEI